MRHWLAPTLLVSCLFFLTEGSHLTLALSHRKLRLCVCLWGLRPCSPSSGVFCRRGEGRGIPRGPAGSASPRSGVGEPQLPALLMPGPSLRGVPLPRFITDSSFGKKNLPHPDLGFLVTCPQGQARPTHVLATEEGLEQE